MAPCRKGTPLMCQWVKTTNEDSIETECLQCGDTDWYSLDPEDSDGLPDWLENIPEREAE